MRPVGLFGTRRFNQLLEHVDKRGEGAKKL
jgi:hypothetical protein